MTFIKIRLPGKWWKCIRLAIGMQIREASRAEVTEMISDLPAISITSGSSEAISSIALIKPCHISVNGF
jgi:hypothetical protein